MERRFQVSTTGGACGIDSSTFQQGQTGGQIVVVSLRLAPGGAQVILQQSGQHVRDVRGNAALYSSEDLKRERRALILVARPQRYLAPGKCDVAVPLADKTLEIF